MSEEIKDQQEQGNKVKKQFDKNFTTLVALMRGEANMRKPKVPNGDVQDIVEQLIAERREEVIMEFKTKAKAAIEEKIKFDQEVKKAREECEKVITEKMKQFNDKMSSLFNLVDKIHEVEQQYYSSIKGAVEANTESKQEEAH